MSSPVPVAATIDLQYRLPPPQQLLFTPTIAISVAVLLIAIVVLVVLARRARAKARREARREALRMMERILLKRGGSQDELDRMTFIFQSNPKVDPSAVIMVHEQFRQVLRPLLEKSFDAAFAEKVEKLYFPPPQNTRRALENQTKDVSALVEEQKTTTAGQTAAALLDLMDATLRPGIVTRLAFEGVEGGFECLVMGHDMQNINVTLPAHNDGLVASLRPGTRVDGTLECGPSLLAYTSNIIQAVAGSMPYCRITPWKSAWEIRKRDSVRLPITLDIDFQHISTSVDSIRMSNLDKEIGTVRPGHLIDISLGGCCIETPSREMFKTGDLIRFSKTLASGNPPATLLGAVVNSDSINPELNNGSARRLHIQFLVIDDVSQRILVRTIRQLQDVVAKNEWIQAQQLLQQMRRNNVKNIGSPASSRFSGDSSALYTGGTTRVKSKKRTTTVQPGTRVPKAGLKPPTRVTGTRGQAGARSGRPSDSTRKRFPPPPSP